MTITVSDFSRYYLRVSGSNQQCCTILPISFGDKGSHLRRLLVELPCIRRSLSWGFSGVFHSCKVNARRSKTALIIALIISDRCYWRNTRGKWSLAINPDRSWWHRQTSLKLFGLSTWFPGQQRFKKKKKKGIRRLSLQIASRLSVLNVVWHDKSTL